MTLETLFAPDVDEQVVLSVCAARRQKDGDWVLAYGSLLLVPESCAQVSWPTWRVAEGRNLGTRTDPPLPPSICVSGETWLLGRTILSLAEAERWFERFLAGPGSECMSTSVLPQVGCLPPMQAHLEGPQALLQVFPGIDSPASSLIAGLGRPAQALVWRSTDSTPFAVPQIVEVESHQAFLPTQDIAGIHVTDESVDASIATTRGLMVGRAERTAWLGQSKGSGDFENYIANLGWDPQRIDLADLEITHVERLGRDTVLSTRLRLEDLDLNDARDAGSCSVRLPTIGRTVTHELLLHTVEGELLDRNGPYPIVEQIVTTMTINGQTLEPRVHGVTDPPPGLEDRLQRRDQLQAELEALLESSAQARMLADRQTAIQQLKAMLTTARGELLVQDRWFGQDLADWRLLDDVAIPVRVLTGKLAKDEQGDVEPAQIGKHVEARYRPKAPIHERLYLWEGGGLTVGGSPTTFGHAPVRIARMRNADVEQWRAEFESLWASPHFQEVPRI